MKQKISINQDIEFSEIHKGKVKPLAKSGYIPFLKKFLGRIVHIVLPKPERLFWLLDKEDINKLRLETSKIKIPERAYSAATKNQILDSLKEITKNPEDFEFNHLLIVINGIEQYYKPTKLTEKIKKAYSIS